MKNLILILGVSTLLMACGKESEYHKSIQGQWYHEIGYVNGGTQNASPMNKDLFITKETFNGWEYNGEYEVIQDGVIRVQGVTLHANIQNNQLVINNGTFTMYYNFVK